jgi:hypothetical protein
MVISTGLKILYSFLCREYINQIHPLNFLLLPPFLICNLPLAWHFFFHNTTLFVSGLYSTNERKHGIFGLLLSL